MKTLSLKLSIVALLLTFAQTGCSVKETESTGMSESGSGAGAATGDSSESKRIDTNGSSTVGPITGVMGEEFESLRPDVDVLVTITGTGTGFGKFATGETDISNASRKIKDKEAALCAENGVEFVELMVAMDGISIVVNTENDFIDTITTAQLNKIFAPNSPVKTWKDVDASWPDEEIVLYSPGRESGTFDYFTDAINGEEGASRSGYTQSGDDNTLVTGVSGNKYALGYFGYGYYEQSKDKLKLLKVSVTDKVEDGIAPDPETIQSGTYQPWARPVFLYVNKASLKKPEVKEFLEFYLGDGQKLISEVGCVEMSAANLKAAQEALAEACK